jgi:hypothetical protein
VHGVFGSLEIIRSGAWWVFEPDVTPREMGADGPVAGVGMHLRRALRSSRRFSAVRYDTLRKKRFGRLQVAGVCEPFDAFLEPFLAGRIGESCVARRPEGTARDRRDVGVFERALTPCLVVIVDG